MPCARKRRTQNDEKRVNWQKGKAHEYRLTWQPPDGLQRKPTDHVRRTFRPFSNPPKTRRSIARG
ncbi:MAG TPA: hypothetical protein DDY14_08850 [Chromatiaceae bacterium]|nr:MAG: hypothetical protein N838_25510 [Thiohalocapsa sp. PB-PSB1]HBG95413.1 hypothetical protein [Chromatiaceae bacterium]